jgi:hypothetical protein
VSRKGATTYMEGGQGASGVMARGHLPLYAPRPDVHAHQAVEVASRGAHSSYSDLTGDLSGHGLVDNRMRCSFVCVHWSRHTPPTSMRPTHTTATTGPPTGVMARALRAFKDHTPTVPS